MPVIYYYGTATYYDCFGNAACGPCDGNTYACAYPNVTGFPGDYTAPCGGSVSIPCLTQLEIVNYCDGTTQNVPIYDHGPGASCRLDATYCFGPPTDCAYRMLDLTPTAFMAVNGDPTAGYVAVRIGYYY